MNKLFVFLLALAATPCLAASPIIYQGTHSKDLTSQGLITNGLTVGQSAQLTVDPSTGNLVTAGNVVSSLVSTTTTVNAGTAFVGPLLRLKNSSHNMDFVPPTLAADLVFTWPNSVGTVSQVLQTDGSGHLSWVSPVTASPTAYSQAPVAVTAVGTAGFPQLGHVLDAKDFTALASNQFTFYNLAANANDGSTQAINLATTGTPTYGATGILGGATAATTSGTQFYASPNAFFNPSSASWAFFGWFKPASWTTTNGIVSQYATGSDRSFGCDLSVSGVICSATNTTNTWDAQIIASGAASFTGWHHVAMVYDYPNTSFRLYLDGKQAGPAVTLANTRAITGTKNFTVGQYFGSENFVGSMEDVGFVSGYAMTADDIRKLAARRFDHNKNIATNNQLWTANWGRSDSTVATQLDASWLVSKSSTSLWADFSGVATGAFVDFSMQNVGQYGTALVPNSTYDSGVLSATPSTTIAHGLGARPVNIVYQYETTTGHFTPLQGSNFCEADATNLYCDWTGLSVSASNRLEIIAGGVPLLSAVPLADATTNGIVNSNGAQTIGGAKTFGGLVTASGGEILPSTNAGTGTGISSSSTTLDFYETATFTTTFTPNGAGSTGSSQAMSITRIGKQVTLQIGSTSGIVCAASSTVITGGTALPARFWPNGAVIVPIGAYINGGSNTNGGQVQVTGSGVININRDVAGTAFTNGGCGVIQSTVTYATP